MMMIFPIGKMMMTRDFTTKSGSDFPKENVDILGSDNRIELSYQSRDKDKQEYSVEEYSIQEDRKDRK